MKTLGLLAWMCISAIGSGLVETSVASRLWLWFVAREYGPGPSLGAWFGIVTVVSMIQSRSRSSAQEEDPIPTLGKLVQTTVMRWMLCGLILALAWLTGTICGWIRP